MREAVKSFGPPQNQNAGYIPTRFEVDEFNSNSRYLRKTLTAGEVGCAIAHAEIYKRFLDSNKDVCVVFEYDAQLVRPFELPVIEGLFRGCNRPIVLLLGWSKEEYPTAMLAARPLVRTPFPPTGTYAYMLNRPAAQLSTQLEELDRGWLADWPPQMSSAKFFLLNPTPVSHPEQAQSNSMQGRVSPAGGSYFQRLSETLSGTQTWRRARGRLSVTLLRDAWFKFVAVLNRLTKSRAG